MYFIVYPVAGSPCVGIWFCLAISNEFAYFNGVFEAGLLEIRVVSTRWPMLEALLYACGVFSNEMIEI